MKKRYEGKIKLYREEMEKYSKDIYDHIMIMYKEMEKDNYDKVDEITTSIENYIKESFPEREKDFFNAFQYYIFPLWLFFSIQSSLLHKIHFHQDSIFG